MVPLVRMTVLDWPPPPLKYLQYECSGYSLPQMSDRSHFWVWVLVACVDSESGGFLGLIVGQKKNEGREGGGVNNNHFQMCQEWIPSHFYLFVA